MSTPFSRGHQVTEIRFELPSDEVSVLDGYCQANDLQRTTVLRRLLKEWSDKKHHEAVSICRVAGSNTARPEGDRE